MIDSRSELRMCLAHEYMGLIGWLCYWLDIAPARWVAWQACCDLVAMAIGQTLTLQGPYAALYALARGRMEVELANRGYPPAENTERGIMVPSYPELRHFALHYAQLASLPRLTTVPDTYWYNLVKTLRNLSNRAMPLVALFVELEEQNTEIGDLPGLVTIARHEGLPCGPGCTVTERMADQEGVKSVQWAKSRDPLIGVLLNGPQQQDHSDVGRHAAHDEPVVEGDGRVRGLGAQPGLWSATGPAADFRGNE